MRREAVVCDLSEDVWSTSACQRLANYVCPLCQRDICTVHRVAQVVASVKAVWPLRPQSQGMLPKDDVEAEHAASVHICRNCFLDLEKLGLRTPSAAEALVTATISAAVEAYGADLAAAKLAAGSQTNPRDDND